MRSKCKHFYRSTFLVYKDRQIPHIFVLNAQTAYLWQPSRLLYIYFLCDVLSWCIERELSSYTAKIIRGNKEGGITKVFFTVIQEIYGE